ncbi:dienelactone hydrolase family protein [Bradyrhizobium sp. Tv2a-2]|uniref:alpha/beta hydrolase family protein n=1 Tax=Bradyrhizobium sp. Tv2a-2 TaxID=113395 RepID=UPI000426F5B6|nr:dienelactone hydrolase family protein [Bradyrhizobium sp. Tv2a-2]
MRSALLTTLLTVLLLPTVIRSAEAESSSPPQLQEEVWGLPFELPTLAYVVHPVGNGPFPLAVMNHGVSLNARERSFFPLVEFRNTAFWFARQGYMVVAPVGPGYGGGGFDVPERGLYGPFFSHVGPCEKPNFRGAGLAIAKLDGWIIDYLIERKTVRPEKVIVIGQSAGGWGAIALSSQNPASVRAIITFAAGRGGRVGGKPDNNCAPDQLVRAAAEFGQTSRVPMLWLYSENDTYFGPVLTKEMHEAFTAAGGDAEYHMLPAVGGEGHFLIHSVEAMPLWTPLVLDFLQRHP